MICAWCKSDIENDSYYCDQCSKEVFLCSACGKPGKGKSCIEDGNALYSPKQKATGGPAGPAAQQRVSLFGGTPAGTPQAAAPTPQTGQSMFGPPKAAPQPSFGGAPTPSPMPSPSPSPSAAPMPSPMGSPQQAPVQQSFSTTPATQNFSSQKIPVLKLVNLALGVDLEVRDGALIGRSQGDYVHVFNQFSHVSGRHMQFVYDAGAGWMAMDLGSTNGVALSATGDWNMAPKITPNVPVPVRDNRFILIANVEFQLLVIPFTNPNQGTVRL